MQYRDQTKNTRNRLLYDKFEERTWYTFQAFQQRRRSFEILKEFVEIIITQFVSLLLEEAGHGESNRPKGVQASHYFWLEIGACPLLAPTPLTLERPMSQEATRTTAALILSRSFTETFILADKTGTAIWNNMFNLCLC